MLSVNVKVDLYKTCFNWWMLDWSVNYILTLGWCSTCCFRLTPAYMLLMMISICLSRYFGDGPLWPDQGMEVNYCKDTWWKNLLYINNLFNEQSVNSFSILSAKIWMSEVKKQKAFRIQNSYLFHKQSSCYVYGYKYCTFEIIYFIQRKYQNVAFTK